MKNGASSHTNCPNAFVEQIVIAHYESLYTFAVGCCLYNRIDVHFADDLLQDLALQILRKYEVVKEGYEKRGVSYLGKMLQNLVIDELRRRKSVHRRQSIVVQRIERHLNIQSLEPALFFKRIKVQLEQLLPQVRAKVFWMYLQGYAYKEIASQLAMPQGTVGTHIRSARQTLRMHYEEE